MSNEVVRRKPPHNLCLAEYYSSIRREVCCGLRSKGESENCPATIPLVSTETFPSSMIMVVISISSYRMNQPSSGGRHIRNGGTKHAPGGNLMSTGTA